MSKELNIIGIAIEDIKNDNLQELDKALRIMPLEKLKDEHQLLLSNFLATCAAYDRPEAAKMILERWKVIYPENDKISIFGRLFLINVINIPTLSYLVSIHEDYTFVEIMDELAEFDSSEDVVTACFRADTVFGPQPYETYQILKDHAIQFSNFKVEIFLIDKIAEIAPFAKKPAYVKNYLSDYFPQFKNRLPTQIELDELAKLKSTTDDDIEKTIETINDDEAIKLLTEGLENVGISIVEIDSAKEYLKKVISSSTQMKKDLLAPILKNRKEYNLEADRLLFWIYGSANPLVNQDLTLKTNSAKYGGCRMMLCDLFDYNEDYDYLEDWFTGSCQQCLLRIEKRCYAVRLPRPHGGWEGNFCSFECVKTYQEEIEGEEKEKDILTNALINAFSKKINEIGINDRN